MKICPVGADLVHGDRRTVRLTERRDDANSCFSYFLRERLKVRQLIDQ